MDRKQRRNMLLGMALLGPNILEFLAFTIIPLAFSPVLAFSNWDLRLHNMFKTERAVGMLRIDRAAAVVRVAPPAHDVGRR